MCQMLCQALRRQSLGVRGLAGKRRWVERSKEVWAYSTSNDIDIPLTQLRFQGRGCLRQELEGFRRGQIQYLKDERSPGKVSVKAGRVKQLETFGERTSNSAWLAQRTLEGAGEGVTVRAIWVGFPKGLGVTLFQLEGGRGKALGCAHKPPWEKFGVFWLFPWMLR